MWYIWLGIAVVCIAFEAATPQLTTIWFALGALGALVASLIAPDIIWLQAVVFIVLSITALIFTRPLARKLLAGKKKRLNADRCLEQEAVVIEEINNILGKGQVNTKGVVWTARSENDEIIEKGTLVTIKRIEGVKVIVEPKK